MHTDICSFSAQALIASNVAGYVGKPIGWLMGGWLCIEIDRHSFCVGKCMKEKNGQHNININRYTKSKLRLMSAPAVSQI